MSVFSERSGDRALGAVCLWVALAIPGCTRWNAADGLPGPFRSSDPSQQADPLANSTGDRAVLARGSDDQDRSVWIHTIRSYQEASRSPDYRWRYPDLEELLARPAGRRPDLHGCLADRDPIVATNAAIALARNGDAAGAERLADAVRSPPLKLPMRRAAAEALAGLQEESAVPLLRELLDQYGRAPSNARTPYVAALHAELIRGLARHVDPIRDPRFLDALRSRSADVRLEALRAFAPGRGGPLPPEVADSRTHGDYRVRAAALQALARRRHPEAYSYLIAALKDHDLRVRTAAIAALGELAGHQAEATLRQLLDGQPEKIRSAAVSALARAGAKQVVLAAAADPSWRVRADVARHLARYPDPGGAAVARKLLGDPSARVQVETVLSVANWPLKPGGPLLLEAMGGRSFLTRQTAAEQLAAQWPPAAEFPVEGPPQRRAVLLKQLEARFGQEFGLADRTAPAAVTPPKHPVALRQVDQIEQLVRDENVAALVRFGPGLVEALDRLVFDRQQPLPEVVYREALPVCASEFAALGRLVSSEVDARRRAARELVELADQRPLSRLAVDRLNQLTAAEPDPLVWQRALAAVAGDGSEPATRLAYAAIGHPSAEVRRRACEHLAACPDPRHADVLLPALAETDSSVRCAAVRALGAAGHVQDTAPLRRLLRLGNEGLRLETAVALIRLGDPAGAAALERLAYAGDPKIRHQVAVAIGQIGDPSLVPLLIRMLDDRVSVRRAALESLAKLVGHDPSRSDDGSQPTTPEQVRRWKQWFSRQAATTLGALEGPAVVGRK